MTFPWPPGVLKRMWRQEYDLFHIQTPFSVGLMGLFVAFARGIPRIFHHHTLWEKYVDYLPIPKELSSRASVWLCRGLANRCQGVISPSSEVQERFQEQGVTTDISVIPTGIRASRFQNGTPLPEKAEDDEVCLFIGRLAHEKSIHVVVRVFAELHQTRPKSRLWLVGDGPARQDLEKLAEELGVSEACRFFGFVDRETLRDYVASAELFLFASVTETQGLVLLEAQAGGLPVVAVKASGVNEAVLPDKTGLLVDPGDEQGMTEAAHRILSSKKLKKELSKQAVSWAEEFSVEKMGEALEGTYEKALKKVENRDK